MAMKRIVEWRKLPVNLTELSIDTTLRCGQSFRWRKLNDEWTCTLHGRILSLKQDETHLHYKVTWPEHRAESKSSGKDAPSEKDDTEDLLRHYFSLNIDLASLYQQWSKDDPNFRKKAPQFTGVRILNQDAWEALICFICSSNNNISRISQMVHKLCKHYGPLIGHIEGEAMHDFPAPESLTKKTVEAHLRELGFGYRAKYIAETARIIAKEKPSAWLDSLRNPDFPAFNAVAVVDAPQSTYKDAQAALLSLTGVGPKVADCIAQRDYRFGKKGPKTINKVMYDAIGDHFRGIWGKYAGWAHSVLFTADLREFSSRIKEEKVKEEKVKEEKVKEEKVKEEKVEELSQKEDAPVSKKGSPRKRKAAVEVEVESVVLVKEEDTKEGVILEVDTTTKRRRTRARP
ncbi:hhH-GPD superfamily base excision DNA repair protein domain-containing protein [Trichoderma breve]|uniref:DNA-(apurinic or apyrimidinic site) lyase n=1 Tax=Trichoderma breve TaxID=2034170 RepID=A0A9W9E6S4_9HYPO|nr:hhH-GPD superfamily base excision DNA repair protein domain-containing protein [Trichoderma breve]KAJ4861123.1 hhH-GPD superfamily base excision DNA repair protein domain-containing protein [Trichoderma breve]